MINQYIYYIIPCSYITVFILGLIIGYIIKQSQNSGVYNSRPKSFFEQQEKNETAKIDDTKYVVNIGTDKLEKKYDSLGDTVVSESNINNAVNKLKNLKR